MNLAHKKVTPIRPDLEVVERRVADTDDGFIMLAMELYEELIGANLTRNQAKVAHAVCRKTYGFKKKMDRIADSQLAELCHISREKANIAKNQLIAMRVLVKEGNRIGPNKNVSEWQIPECYQVDNFVTKAVTESVTNSATQGVTKTAHTKDIIQNIKDKTPLPPSGVRTGPKKSSVKKSVPYQAVLEAYNEAAADRLPTAEALNEKRKRGIKRLLNELKEPTVEAAGNYFSAFMTSAKPFYFGENSSGWRANFDYLLRSDTLTKTREGSL